MNLPLLCFLLQLLHPAHTYSPSSVSPLSHSLFTHPISFFSLLLSTVLLPFSPSHCSLPLSPPPPPPRPLSLSCLLFFSYANRNTDTHPLSSFSLLMLSFSCCSFSSISLLSWARVTVSVCSSCRFLWQHTHTHSLTYSICN